jgi:two-component system, cell cycle response regulator
VVHNLPSWRGLETSPWPPGASDDAIARLLDMAEDAAPEVAAHMERTARLARLFALQVEMPDALHQLVVRTAQLHDIGKLAISPWVVDKPAPLSQAEERLMRTHPAMGQRILERRPVLMALAPLVRATHERWDGRGYPDGLRGAEIPLPSRVVGICDAFDAMTSDRPYSSAMPIDEALDEIRRGAGTQFDPGAAEMFCHILNDGIDRWAVGA